jgi:hypothetical protein
VPNVSRRLRASACRARSISVAGSMPRAHFEQQAGHDGVVHVVGSGGRPRGLDGAVGEGDLQGEFLA